MAEEKIIKEETQPENQPEEKLESAEDVVTEPKSEDTQEPKDLVQLEQRITSLEQRIQSLEDSKQNESSDDPNFEDKTEPTVVDDDQESDNIESTDEIKEMLNL